MVRCVRDSFLEGLGLGALGGGPGVERENQEPPGKLQSKDLQEEKASKRLHKKNKTRREPGLAKPLTLGLSHKLVTVLGEVMMVLFYRGRSQQKPA